MRHAQYQDGAEVERAFVELPSKHRPPLSGEKQFKCDVCEKTFKTSQTLAQHRRIHSGERPFKCDQCDKSFTQSAGLIVHRRVHSEEKTIQM